MSLSHGLPIKPPDDSLLAGVKTQGSPSVSSTTSVPACLPETASIARSPIALSECSSADEPTSARLESESPAEGPHGVIELDSGYQLAFNLYGDPAGQPILYFHDSGGSRLEAVFHNESASLLGYKVIAVDRPGVGCSDFYPLDSPVQWAGDLTLLLDRLGVDQCGVMAMGGGAVFSLAMASRYPQRVRFQLAISGVPGLALTGNRPNTTVKKVWRSLTPTLVHFLARIQKRFSPELFAADSISRLAQELDYTDRKLLSDPLVFKALVDDKCEATRNGLDGVIQDWVTCSRKLEFELCSIQTPTSIWLGAADRLTARSDCEFLATQLPDADFHCVNRLGHYFYIHQTADILRRARRIA